MSSEKFFSYHPERVLWVGFSLIGILLVCLSLWLFCQPVETIFRNNGHKRVKEEKAQALSIALTLCREEPWQCPIPDIVRDVAFSFDPPRPHEANQPVQLSVRLKERVACKRFTVPCRIDLIYNGGVLSFSEKPSSFLLQLERCEEGLIGTVFVDGRSGEPFSIEVEESPLQTAKEFPETSPFRILAEGKWWGTDLCLSEYASGKVVHRIDLGSPIETKLINLEEGGWLGFQNGAWKEIEESHQAQIDSIARVRIATNAQLEMEGWEGSRHVRLSLPHAPPSPFKVKAEEMFSSVRVRSDKQISCMLDKRCLILKVNDWVLKTGDRWKILRKAEEKDAFLKGKIVGELFVLDHIFSKQGQKSISGRMFNLARTQMASIDLPVSNRKLASAHSQTTAEQKGKSR